VALTSPPLISALGALFARIKGGHFYFWVMDLNPDEAIAAGWLSEASFTSRSLQSVLRYSLRAATRIFVLDRFMKDRILAKDIDVNKVSVVPPWAHDDAVSYDEQGRQLFRAEHGLGDKFVVMYSGNHSPCHPLDTVLAAAEKLASRNDISFCFVGGGSEHLKVRSFAAERKLENIACLPYQPLERLSASLSSADMHVVVMGDRFRGIVHPCKIYNILTLGIPILYVGPKESHVTDLINGIEDEEYAYAALHGESDRVVEHIVACSKKAQKRSTVARALATNFGRDHLVSRMKAAMRASLDAPSQRASHAAASRVPPM
jgi:glycosyltransferase involved in cell wall biosynthesis